MADAAPPDDDVFRPHYDTVVYLGGPLLPSARGDFATELRKHHLDLVFRRRDGVEERVPRLTTRIDPHVAQVGAQMLRRGASGGEVDAIVAYRPDGQLLASLWWEEDRLIVAQREHTGALIASAPPALASLGVGQLVSIDRSWDATSEALVAQAYATLSPEERDVLAWLPLWRCERSPDEPDEDYQSVIAGQYHHGASPIDEPRVQVYDLALNPWPQFTGTLDDPYPAAVRVLIHELGHAFDDAAARVGWLLVRELTDAVEVDRALLAGAPSPDRATELTERLARRTAALRDVQTWLGADPVLDAYLVAVGDEPAPTAYGRTRGREGFAESFALWHVDRPALVRVSPKAAAFFDAGRHLAVVSDAIAQVQALAAPGL
jgi:hypothetical protein